MRFRNDTLCVCYLIGLLFCVGLTRAQVVNTIYSFDGTNGAEPNYAPVTQGRDGNLYGTTSFGGVNNMGTVFSLTPDGSEVVLHNFDGADGSFPSGGLTLATDGNFYGAAFSGGALGHGALFKMSRVGVLSVLYSFTGGSDSDNPLTPPIEGRDGNFYGLTQGDPTGVPPTLYKLTPSGLLSTLFTFPVAEPSIAPLMQAAGGSLFVVTGGGGTLNAGAIWRFTTSGILNGTYSFHPSQGNTPLGGVIQATDGNIYGATWLGGSHMNGTIFEIDRSGIATFLYSFGATPSDGLQPEAGFVQATDGNFYGATSLGGSAGAGSLYEFTNAGTYSQLYSFDLPPGGNTQAPVSALIQHTNGTLYGVTSTGGTSGQGSVYSLDAGLGPLVAFVLPVGRVGQSAQILGQGLRRTTSVTFNGVPATNFKVVTDTFMTAVVPTGATTGPVVVTTPSGALTSNKNFVIREPLRMLDMARL